MTTSITYPTEYMYGKPIGSIKKINSGYQVIIKDINNIQKCKLFKFINYNNNDKQTYEAACKYRLDESTKNGFTRNQIRYLDASTIEIKLTSNVLTDNDDDYPKTFITDAKFLDIIEEYALKASYTSRTGIKKFYVAFECIEKNTKIRKYFAKVITNYKIVKYINGNTMDCRLSNLKEFYTKNKDINVNELDDDLDTEIDDDLDTEQNISKMNDIEIDNKKVNEENEETEETTRKCNKCNIIKSLDNFNKNASRKLGRAYTCKDCSHKLTQKYKEANKEHVSDYNKEYRIKNKEILKQKYNKPEEEKKQNILNYRNKYFNELVDIVNQKGGYMMSNENEYINMHSKLDIKCNNNHIFQTIGNNIKHNDRWCPHCNLKRGEAICKYVIEKLFECEFKKVRPKWLVSNNNTLLELDMYNDNLKLAIEYNGIQHYEYITYFHKSEDDFKMRQKYDEIKIDLCKKNNVKLIIVPYIVDNGDIAEYIYKQLQEYGYKIDKAKLDSLNLNEIDNLNSIYNKVVKIVTEKNGVLLDGLYYDRECNIVIRCDKNHEFTKKIKYLFNDTWCELCSKSRSESSKEKISNGMKEFLASEEGFLSKLKSLEKRSDTMLQQKQKIQDDIANGIVTQKICTKCNVSKSLDNFCKKAAAKDGLQPFCKSCTNIIKKNSRIKKQQKE